MPWLILRVHLIGLRDAQSAGKMLFLGVFVSMFWKKSSLHLVDRKEDSHSPMWEASADPLRAPTEQNRQRKGKFSFYLLELGHSFCLALRHGSSSSGPCLLELNPAACQFSGLWHPIESYHRLFWFSSLWITYGGAS